MKRGHTPLFCCLETCSIYVTVSRHEDHIIFCVNDLNALCVFVTCGHIPRDSGDCLLDVYTKLFFSFGTFEVSEDPPTKSMLHSVVVEMNASSFRGGD